MRTPLLSRFLTIAFVLGLCLAAVLGRDLRLGKDLRGGVSLVLQNLHLHVCKCGFADLRLQL